MQQQHRIANPFVRSGARKAMSITQTYFLAHKARAKLSREAAQPDHDLRLLVGHANLLDSLMVELADAEREQERWFNQSVRGASSTKTTTTATTTTTTTTTSPPPSPRRVQWADRVVDEDEDDDSSDSDSDSDFDVDDADVVASALRRQAPAALGLDDEDMGDDDLEDDYAQLELVRTHSHAGSPPGLVDHDSDSSDDEPMPPSPGDAGMPYSEAEAKESQPEEDALYQDEAYYAPCWSPGGLVSAISVY